MAAPLPFDKNGEPNYLARSTGRRGLLSEMLDDEDQPIDASNASVSAPVLQEIVAPTGEAAYASQQRQQALEAQLQNDRTAALMGRLGPIGATLIAAGLPQTAESRAQIMSNLPNYMGGLDKDIQSRQQARQAQIDLMNSQRDGDRRAALEGKMQDPAFLRQVGINPAQAQVLGSDGLLKILVQQMSESPSEKAYREAQVAKLRQGDFGVVGEDEFGNKQYGWYGGVGGGNNQPQPAQSYSGGNSLASNGQQQPSIFDKLNGLSGQEAITTLKQHDPSLGAEVEQIVNGNQPFPQRMLGTKRGQVLSSLVSMVDPEYNASTYDVRKKMKVDYNNSSLNSAGGQIKYANTGIKHGAELLDLADKLPNHTNFGPLNRSLNNLDAHYQIESVQGGTVNSYKQAAQNFIEEIGKALGAGASGEKERLEKNLDAASGPEAIKEVLRTQIALLRDKIGTMDNAWQEGMGQAGKGRKLVDPDAEKALNRIFPPERDAGASANKEVDHYAASLANARQAIAKNPAARDAIIKKLRDHGVSTEGL